MTTTRDDLNPIIQNQNAVLNAIIFAFTDPNLLNNIKNYLNPTDLNRLIEALAKGLDIKFAIPSPESKYPEETISTSQKWEIIKQKIAETTPADLQITLAPVLRQLILALISSDKTSRDKYANAVFEREILADFENFVSQCKWTSSWEQQVKRYLRADKAGPTVVTVTTPGIYKLQSDLSEFITFGNRTKVSSFQPRSQYKYANEKRSFKSTLERETHRIFYRLMAIQHNDKLLPDIRGLKDHDGNPNGISLFEERVTYLFSHSEKPSWWPGSYNSKFIDEIKKASIETTKNILKSRWLGTEKKTEKVTEDPDSLNYIGVDDSKSSSEKNDFDLAKCRRIPIMKPSCIHEINDPPPSETYGFEVKDPLPSVKSGFELYLDYYLKINEKVILSEIEASLLTDFLGISLKIQTAELKRQTLTTIQGAISATQLESIFSKDQIQFLIKNKLITHQFDELESKECYAFENLDRVDIEKILATNETIKPSQFLDLWDQYNRPTIVLETDREAETGSWKLIRSHPLKTTPAIKESKEPEPKKEEDPSIRPSFRT